MWTAFRPCAGLGASSIFCQHTAYSTLPSVSLTSPAGSIHHWAAKPFGRPVDAGKAGSERCTRLVQVTSRSVSMRKEHYLNSAFVPSCLQHPPSLPLLSSQSLQPESTLKTGCWMQTCVLLNIATVVYGLALMVYGASLRTAMRERFGIQGRLQLHSLPCCDRR